MSTFDRRQNMPNQMTNRMNDEADINLENVNESTYLAVDTSAAKMLTSQLLQVLPGNQQMQMRLQLPPPATGIQLMPLINTGMPAQLLQQPPPTSPNQQSPNLRFHSPMRGGYAIKIKQIKNI